MRNLRYLSKIEKAEINNYIIENHQHNTIQQLADELDISYNAVSKIKHRHKLTTPHFDMPVVTTYQHQILLGGILGDGNFKINGKSSAYYRECHADSEKDYMAWKYDKLVNLTTGKIYPIRERNGGQSQTGIQTRSSPIYLEYKNMSLDTVIEQIDELGILVWILDDGWISKKMFKGRISSACINVSGGMMDIDQKRLLCNRILDTTDIQVNLSGIKSVDFAIPVAYNNKIYDLMMKHFDKDMDIIKKKIWLLNKDNR